jgi:hypothetical protein
MRERLQKNPAVIEGVLQGRLKILQFFHSITG